MSIRHLHYLYYLRQLVRTQWLPKEELIKLQEKKLRRIVRHAYYNTEFYRQKFDSVGVKPEKINTLDDLQKLPIIYKDDLRQNFENKRIIAKGYNTKNCFITHTSGSSGKILHILHNPRAHYFTRAFTMRLFSCFNMKRNDKLGFITHTPEPFESSGIIQLLGLYPINNFPGIWSIEKLWEEIQKIKPDILQSYGGIWLEITRKFGKENTFNPKLIVLVGESTSSEEREYVSQCFNCEVADGYPSHEFNLIAWECNHHHGLHINSEGIILEIVKDNNLVSIGDSGEIVITSLENYAMPFIRYNIEDIGRLIPENCSCGRRLPLMNHVDGRKDDFFVLPSGRNIPPGQICGAIMKIVESDNNLLDFMIIQETKDYIIVKIKVKPNNSFTINKRIKDVLNELFNEPISIKVEEVEQIERKVAHKRRKIISKVQ